MLNYSPLLEIYTVSFFGHRYVDQFTTIENRLEELIIKLLEEHEYVDFLVGRNGDFDQIVSSTIKRVKRDYRDDNCTHILVLPYNSAEFQNNEDSFSEYYDEIEICPEAHAAHFKAAIQIRNRNMIDRSDLCIFYVEHNSGGAFQSLQYAIKQNRQITNIARSPDSD
ncbi:MAG: DUF1273 family protein [Clostridia bacterium]|nr:DUF1273 family protein [Clostridia bacterium]